MWNELESYKNHYLQKELKHLKAQPISQMVRKEFEIANARRDLCRAPFKKNCDKSTYLEDHAQLGYGWFALPKLMRELCSPDNVVRWRAINSLSEFLVNPLQAQRAIHEMDIVRKVHNCLMRIRRRIQTEQFNEVRQLMVIVELLASYLNGAQLFGQRKFMLHEFYRMISNNDEHQHAAMRILQKLSEKPKVCLQLLESTDCLEQVAKIFGQDICKPHYDAALWAHLGHFLELAPERGIAAGFFEILHKRIKGHVPGYYRDNMRVFAMLLRCPEGLQMFDDQDCVPLLCDVLRHKLETFEFTMLALLHGLQSKRALRRARVFTQLPEMVFNCTRDTKNQRLQLYGLQTIRQLGEMPSIKRQIRGLAMGLRQLTPLSGTTECLRNELVEWLRFDKCLLRLRLLRPRPKRLCATAITQ